MTVQGQMAADVGKERSCAANAVQEATFRVLSRLSAELVGLVEMNRQCY